MRAGFFNLELAEHHFKLAKKKFLLAQELKTVVLPLPGFDQSIPAIEGFKNQELESRFTRISPDLFIRIFSFCDAPSLVLSSGVNKTWREAINQCSKLFQIFRMEGKGTNIVAGLESFNRRFPNSLEKVKLKVKDKLRGTDQTKLVKAISASSNIQSLVIGHQMISGRPTQSYLGSQAARLKQKACRRHAALWSGLGTGRDDCSHELTKS